MVCALYRLFQSSEDDRIMEGDPDPRDNVDTGDHHAAREHSRPESLARLVRAFRAITVRKKQHPSAT